MNFPGKVIGIQVEIYLVIEILVLFQFLDPMLLKHAIVLLFCIQGCFIPSIFVLICFYLRWLLSRIHAVIKIFLFDFSELLRLVFWLQTSLFTGVFAGYVELGFWIK